MHTLTHPHDHIDLLLAGAQRYGLLRPPMDDLSVKLIDAAGLRLVRCLPSDNPPRHYAAKPVPVFEPIEVVKACHAFEHVAAQNAHWPRSKAHEWVQTLHRAAVEALPGYAQAAWNYQRQQDISGSPVIAVAGASWRPDLPVTWTSPEQATHHWLGAELVLVTEEALPRFSRPLPERSGVYLLVDGDHQTPWTELGHLVPDVVVQLPMGRSWLLDQISQPLRAFRRARTNPGTSSA